MKIRATLINLGISEQFLDKTKYLSWTLQIGSVLSQQSKTSPWILNVSNNVAHKS